MTLIDIKKLNDELNAMIAAQEAEIQRMEDEITERNAYRLMQMITQMNEFAVIAKEFEENIFVNLPIKWDGYSTRIRITPRGFSIEYLNYLGFVNTQVSIRFNRTYNSYCYDEQVTTVLDWWWGHAAEFRRMFEEECVKILCEKAEKANAKYKAATDKYSSAMARKVDGCRTPESQVAGGDGGTTA